VTPSANLSSPVLSTNNLVGPLAQQMLMLNQMHRQQPVASTGGPAVQSLSAPRFCYGPNASLFASARFRPAADGSVGWLASLGWQIDQATMVQAFSKILQQQSQQLPK